MLVLGCPWTLCRKICNYFTAYFRQLRGYVRIIHILLLRKWLCRNCRHKLSVFYPRALCCKISNTERFIMFPNVYNKKTKKPTLMEFFTATGKLKKFLLFFYFLTTRRVRRVHHGWHGTHRYDIQVLATHVSAFGVLLEGFSFPCHFLNVTL
jgi:hypothetical protein